MRCAIATGGRGQTVRDVDDSTAPQSPAAAATTGRSVLAGSAWYATSRIVPQLYTLVVSVVAARYLGPDGMGRQSFIAFVELSVILVLTGGMFASLLRHVGEVLGRDEPGAVRSLLGWAWRLMALAAAVGGGALAAVGLLGGEPRGAWLLAAVAASMTVMQTIPTAVLIGLQRWKEATLVGLATGLVATAATVVVLAAGGGITGMFAVEAAVAAVNLAGVGYLALRSAAALEHRGTATPELRRRVGRYAAAMSIGVVLTLVVARRSEVFFLAQAADDAEIAVYSIVFAVMAALLRLPEAVGAALAPAFATLVGAEAHDRIRTGFDRALRLLLIVVLPLAAVAAAIGPELLVLLYGDEYAATGTVLIVMLIALPLVPLGELSESLVTGFGRIRAPLVVTGVAAAVDIAVAAALVRPYGAVGAAVANVAAQVVLALGALVIAHRLLGSFSLPFSAVGRAAAAAAAAGLAAWLPVELIGGVAGVVVGAAAGAVAFLLAGRAVRVLGADDARWLTDALAGRLGRLAGGTVRLLSGGST